MDGVLSRKWATQNEMKTSALLIIFMDTFFSGAKVQNGGATWRIIRGGFTNKRIGDSLGATVVPLFLHPLRRLNVNCI